MILENEVREYSFQAPFHRYLIVALARKASRALLRRPYLTYQSGLDHKRKRPEYPAGTVPIWLSTRRSLCHSRTSLLTSIGREIYQFMGHRSIVGGGGLLPAPNPALPTLSAFPL